MQKQLSLMMFSLLSIGFYITTFSEAPSTSELEIRAASILLPVVWYIDQVVDELQRNGPFDEYTQNFLTKMATIKKKIDGKLSSMSDKIEVQTPHVKNIINNLPLTPDSEKMVDELEERRDIAQLAKQLKQEMPEQIKKAQQELENKKIMEIIGSYINLQIIQAARTYNDLINNLKKKGALTLDLPEKLTFENILNYAR